MMTPTMTMMTAMINTKKTTPTPAATPPTLLALVGTGAKGTGWRNRYNNVTIVTVAIVIVTIVTITMVVEACRGEGTKKTSLAGLKQGGVECIGSSLYLLQQYSLKILPQCSCNFPQGHSAPQMS